LSHRGVCECGGESESESGRERERERERAVPGRLAARGWLRRGRRRHLVGGAEEIRLGGTVPGALRMQAPPAVAAAEVGVGGRGGGALAAFRYFDGKCAVVD
jgi:hypothetical protein